MSTPPSTGIDRTESGARVLWRPSGRSARWIVGTLALVALLIRLTYLSRAARPDEAGYLKIAQQWHGAGSSLYTNLWVDRPPLLITIFQIGDALGGLGGVRVVAALIGAIVVIGTAVTTNLLAGRRAAVVAAVAITAWTVSPAFSTTAVNGEYLAAPFIVWSMAATLAALKSADERRSLLFGFLAGASGFAALLVKQNQADGLLFGLLACLLARPLFGTAAARARKVFAAAAVGCGVTLASIGLLCVWRGTSIAGVYEAMFPFRFQASAVKRAAGMAPFSDRFAEFGHVWLVSGVLLVMVAALAVAVLGRAQRTAVVLLVTLLVFVHVSIASGDEYFAHYLVQALVPIAVLAGIAATRSRFIVPLVVALAVASAASVVPRSMFTTAPTPLSKVGDSLKAVGKPGDSIVVFYGNPEVVLGSGMRPAYEYLFALPIYVRDPKLRELNSVVEGSARPTWIVKWVSLDGGRLPTAELKVTLKSRYRQIATVCDKPILLLKGVDRPAPKNLCAPKTR